MGNINRENPQLVMKIDTEKGIHLVHINGNEECKLCYEVFDVSEYLNNLNTGINFPHRNFVIDDLVGLFEDSDAEKIKHIIYILWIRTEQASRNKGYATQLMRAFLDCYANSADTIVVLRAAPMMYDYIVEPTKIEYRKFFKNARKFLVPFGFHSFQSLCGLEFGEPYIYLSSISSAAKCAWSFITDHYYDDLED